MSDGKEKFKQTHLSVEKTAKVFLENVKRSAYEFKLCVDLSAQISSHSSKGLFNDNRLAAMLKAEEVKRIESLSFFVGLLLPNIVEMKTALLLPMHLVCTLICCLSLVTNTTSVYILSESNEFKMLLRFSEMALGNRFRIFTQNVL